MAATVPNSLKSADITRFAARAAQVEKAKPAVSYWCKSDETYHGLESEMFIKAHIGSCSNL